MMNDNSALRTQVYSWEWIFNSMYLLSSNSSDSKVNWSLLYYSLLILYVSYIILIFSDNGKKHKFVIIAL